MSTSQTHPATPGAWALALGYGGLIPFLALAIGPWLLPAQQPLLQYALQAYGAVILSFLGAIHWGLSLREDHATPALLVWGVVPSLLAWLALLLPAVAGLYVLAASLWLCLAVDHRVYPRFHLSAWLPMRLALTTVASLCCVVLAWGAAR